MDSNDDFRKKDLHELKAQTKEDLFEALGVKDISDEEKAVLLTKMLRLVDVKTLSRIIDQLTPEQEEKLKNLNQDDEMALEKFLEENVPTYGDMYIEEAQKVRQELLIEFQK
jgi:ribosomal protein S13